MPIGTLSQKIQCQSSALGDRAADQRADRDRETGDAAPRAERDRATLGRHGARTGSSGSAA